MASKYATRQRAAVLSYMQNKGEAYSSASEIRQGLGEAGENMGLTTIYRHLKNLEEEGLVVSINWRGFLGLPTELQGVGQTRRLTMRIQRNLPFIFNVRIAARW